MPLTPKQRSLRASGGGNALHGKRDSREIAARARAGFRAKFVNEVRAEDPDLPEAEVLRRAEHRLRAHMAKLALQSSRARQVAAR